MNRFVTRTWGWLLLGMLAVTAPVFGQNEGGATIAQPTTEELLRAVRVNWQTLDTWFQRSPQYYNRWMRHLQKDALLAQWNLGTSADMATIRDLEANLKRYLEYISDPRYQQFVTSFSDWKTAATRDNIRLIAANIRRQANQNPQNASNNPSFYRQQIASAVREVQVGLIPFTPQGAKDWRRFLKWDTLLQLSAGSDPLPLETLQDLQVILRNGVVVWDVPAMKQLQQAIDEAAIQAAVAEEKDYPAARKEKLEDLAILVEAFAIAPTNENRLAMGPAIWWLRSHGELRNVLPGLLYHVSIPNFRYETTAGVIERDVNQHVDENLNVNDVYNGASVRGNAKLDAHLQANLLPSSRTAAWELRMNGTTVSRTNASGQGVTLTTSGNTTISATKKITMDASGMKTQPATAAADARINFSNVDASSYGGYENYARDRVYGSQFSAESQAEQRTEAYIRQRLDQDGSRYVKDYNQTYQDNFVYPRARQLSWPHTFRMWSTSEILVMDMLDGPLDSLGASVPAPLSPFEADAYVKSHVTSFDAYGWRKLAGKKLTVTELKQIMVDLGMRDEVDPPTEAKTESEPAAEATDAAAAARNSRTLHFPSKKPIEFTLAGGLLTGIAHLDGFSSDGSDYDPMTVKFTYRLTGGPGGIDITRESLEAWPASFVPGSGQRLSGPQLTVRKLLVNVLKDALPEKTKLTHVSGGLGEDMPITNFANLGEWLCIGMSLPPQPKPAIGEVPVSSKKQP